MTNGYLDTLWSKAVRAQKGNRCVNCGGEVSGVHHVIRRARRVLRHDPLNGLPLCAECHKTAHQIPGWDRQYLTGETLRYLDSLARLNIKDYLVQRGLTRKEFDKRMSDNLKAIIKEAE